MKDLNIKKMIGDYRSEIEDTIGIESDYKYMNYPARALFIDADGQVEQIILDVTEEDYYHAYSLFYRKLLEKRVVNHTFNQTDYPEIEDEILRLGYVIYGTYFDAYDNMHCCEVHYPKVVTKEQLEVIKEISAEYLNVENSEIIFQDEKEKQYVLHKPIPYKKVIQ